MEGNNIVKTICNANSSNIYNLAINPNPSPELVKDINDFKKKNDLHKNGFKIENNTTILRSDKKI